MDHGIFEAKSVRYSTPAGRVLQENLNFQVRAGQLLMITGSNGCGKSTLLRSLLGQIPIERGSIHRRVAEDKLQYIPQLENTEVHFPITLQDALNLQNGKRASWEQISSIGLLRKDLLSSAWNTASGGERKRTLLTRALLSHPTALVFDEPMNHLDSESRSAIVRVMANFLRNTGDEKRAIVMVCHQGLKSEERDLFDIIDLDLDGGAGNA
jgi:ABC-type Mn2+/Zn2+ transport system ATPase subunit